VASDSLFIPKGLYTDANRLGAVPKGALRTADNVSLSRDGIAEKFRGNETSAIAGTVAGYIDKTGVYLNAVVMATDAGALKCQGVGSFQGGPFNRPDSDNRVRFMEAGGSLFITTALGILKLDGHLLPPALSVANLSLPGGLQKLPLSDLEWNLVTSGGFLADGYVAGYRAVLGYTDSKGRVVRGPPSGRAVVQNTTEPSGTSIVWGYNAGQAKNVQHIVKLSGNFIPSSRADVFFVELYRTSQVLDGIDPGEEMQLVKRQYLTSTNVSNGFVQVTDTLPDALRGATAYFAQSQEGLINSNDPPPLARDVALFRNCALYFNTTDKHRLLLTVTAVGGSAGIAATDVLTIAGSTYTAKASVLGIPTNGDFVAYTAGTLTQNIDLTARYLVMSINNRSGNSSVYAYYASGPNDPPGRIILEERGIGGSAFSAIASAHGSAYFPELPTSGTAIASDNGRRKNRLYISKVGQFEAVPPTSFVDVGAGEADGYRILALRDSVFILKADGIFRLTGDSPANFRVEAFDTTAVLMAPESAVALANQVVGLFNQGVCAVSDGGGVQVLSRPIEGDLFSLFTSAPAQVKAQSWALAYETERRYELHLPSTAADTYPTQAYVFNLFTRAWSRRGSVYRHGVVLPSEDKAYYAQPTTTMSRERKARTAADFQDETGAGIPLALKFTPFTGGAPTVAKQWHHALLLFDGALPTTLTATFTSPVAAESVVVVTPANETSPGVLLVEVPVEHQDTPHLTVKLAHDVAQEAFTFLGLVLDFDAYDAKGVR